MSKTKVNMHHKDRLFKKIFESKADLLDLYNAINGTDHKNPEDIEVNTIENFIFMTMKNDISFLIANVMNLYEQQSTLNPNMPLRGFLYFAELYRKSFDNDKSLFRSKLIELPVPQFVVFYNGTSEEADRRIMRMSDAFSGEMKDNASLECTALVLNINYGHNKEIMQKCKKLDGYSSFIYRIRQYMKAGMALEEAIDKSTDDCIKEGILVDILEKHRSEAKAMILEEFDLEFHINSEKAISYEDGLAEGRAEGLAKGRAEEVFSSVSEGDYSASRGAQKLNMSEEEFIKNMKAAGYKIPCGV